MKAMLQDRYGPPDVIVFGDTSRPTVTANEHS